MVKRIRRRDQARDVGNLATVLQPIHETVGRLQVLLDDIRRNVDVLNTELSHRGEEH